MVTKFISAYTFHGQLSRLPFLIWFLFIVGIGGLAIWIHRTYWNVGDLSDSSYLFLRFCIDLIVVVLFLPLVFSRLRDIDCPHHFGFFFLLIPVFDPKIYIWYSNISGSSVTYPAAVFYSGMILGVGCMLLLLILILWPGVPRADT